MPEKNGKILLVEDNKFLSQLYVGKLYANNFDVELAENGREALEKAKDDLPDLILLEIVIPELDGFEVIENLKKDAQTKQIPVVILTNLTQKEAVEKGFQLGAADYLIKAHFTPTEVVAKVKKIIAKKLI